MHCNRTTLIILSLAMSLGLLVTAAQAAPSITSPTPGSTLSGSTETFSYTAGSTAVTDWWLYVGTSQGAKDLHDSGALGLATSQPVTGLPTDGTTVHVRLWYRVTGSWLSRDDTYTAQTLAGSGGLDAPPPWSRSLPGAERFVRVLPTAATPEGEGVLDKETGLVWEQSPDTTAHVWEDKFTPPVDARRHCVRRGTGGKMGWRLPSIQELMSLLVPGNPTGGPDLPAGHPFSNVLSFFYWSATANVDNPLNAWVVVFGDGFVDTTNKSSDFFVLCVRGGGPLSEY